MRQKEFFLLVFTCHLEWLRFVRRMASNAVFFLSFLAFSFSYYAFSPSSSFLLLLLSYSASLPLFLPFLLHLLLVSESCILCLRFFFLRLHLLKHSPHYFLSSFISFPFSSLFSFFLCLSVRTVGRKFWKENLSLRIRREWFTETGKDIIKF